MIRSVAIILCTALLLCFAGCTNESGSTNTDETSASTTEAPTISTDPTIGTAPNSTAVYESSMASVAMPLITEVQRSENVVIAYYTHQDISLTLPDADVAQQITLDMLNRIDKSRPAAEKVLSSAASDYTGNQNWYPYSYTITFSPMRLDENILSFFGTESSFDGSPRSIRNDLSVTYDLTTGEPLSLKKILHEENFADALCDLIVDSLSNKKDQLFPDYEKLVRDKFSTNVTVSNWYFSKNGLCFYFVPYEIAPYSAGTIVAEVPYSKLSGLMTDIYFPGEQLQTNGQVLVQKLDDFSITENYEQFARVSLVPDKDKLLITSDGSITDVRIIYDPQSPNSGVMESVILSVAGLGPTDAILLELDAEAAAGRIGIRFDSNGQNQTLFLTKTANGEYAFSK